MLSSYTSVTIEQAIQRLEQSLEVECLDEQLPVHQYRARSVVREAALAVGRNRFHATAFSRNQDIISPTEQSLLAKCRVAIPGMGGVGGSHLLTLIRLGVGGFTLADFDRFEIANFNRQTGAKISTLKQPKLDVMYREALDINPHLELKRFSQGISKDNIDEFLSNVDLVIDSLDFFEFEIRRLLFRRAAAKGITVITAAPIGFGTTVLVFTPDGMSFDEYFDIRPGMSTEECTLAYQLGLSPDWSCISYFDLN